jgi:hypothetical protein
MEDADPEGDAEVCAALMNVAIANTPVVPVTAVEAISESRWKPRQAPGLARPARRCVASAPSSRTWTEGARTVSIQHFETHLLGFGLVPRNVM